MARSSHRGAGRPACDIDSEALAEILSVHFGTVRGSEFSLTGQSPEVHHGHQAFFRDLLNSGTRCLTSKVTEEALQSEGILLPQARSLRTAWAKPLVHHYSKLVSAHRHWIYQGSLPRARRESYKLIFGAPDVEGAAAASTDVVAAEVDLESAYSKQGALRGADLGRVVRQRADIVPEDGRRVG